MHQDTKSAGLIAVCKRSYKLVYSEVYYSSSIYYIARVVTTLLVEQWLVQHGFMAEQCCRTNNVVHCCSNNVIQYWMKLQVGRFYACRSGPDNGGSPVSLITFLHEAVWISQMQICDATISDDPEAEAKYCTSCWRARVEISSTWPRKWRCLPSWRSSITIIQPLV